MEKEFIPCQQALILKRLGFGSSPIGSTNGGSVFYYENGKLYYDGLPMYSSSYHEGQILAPLFQQAFRWFREEYGMYLRINRHKSNTNQITWIVDSIVGKHLSFEEAELSCLNRLIQILEDVTNINPK